MNCFCHMKSDSAVDCLTTEPLCSVCAGLLTPVGVLGTLTHFRCVRCGSFSFVETDDNKEGSAAREA
jgi:hypothetical protein